MRRNDNTIGILITIWLLWDRNQRIDLGLWFLSISWYFWPCCQQILNTRRAGSETYIIPWSPCSSRQDIQVTISNVEPQCARVWQSPGDNNKPPSPPLPSSPRNMTNTEHVHWSLLNIYRTDRETPDRDSRHTIISLWQQDTATSLSPRHNHVGVRIYILFVTKDLLFHIKTIFRQRKTVCNIFWKFPFLFRGNREPSWTINVLVLRISDTEIHFYALWLHKLFFWYVISAVLMK